MAFKSILFFLLGFNIAIQPAISAAIPRAGLFKAGSDVVGEVDPADGDVVIVGGKFFDVGVASPSGSTFKVSANIDVPSDEQ
ncbi:hypothetical protein TWF694_011379 [Orbilia ellipsospora]|uniref:Uncharacterized protein n=1 Tax=Orbilia ellipsospora TaxID=2528407 RepID=A0AAV9X529_9PEZI